MPKSLNKRKPNNKQTRTVVKQRLNIGLKSIVGNITFSETERIAYYKVSNKAFDFLEFDSQVRLGEALTKALSAIYGERQEPLDIHLIIDSVPTDIDAFLKHNEDAINWSTPEYRERFMEEQEFMLRDREYMQKEVYIGVVIGKRGTVDISASSVLEAGVKGAIDTSKKWLSNLLETPDIEVSRQEEEYALMQEKEIYNTLSSGALNAERATSEEILLCLKRIFHPAMPAPYLDIDHEYRIGPGDIALETGHAIRNRLRWLEITQIVQGVEMTGYRATLTFSKFPKAMAVPAPSYPFFYMLTKTGLPFSGFARFTFHPVSRMSEEIRKKGKESRDEVENYAGAIDSIDSTLAGGSLPAHLEESLSDMNAIESMINQDKSPWIEGSYFINVTAVSEEALKRYCEFLRQQYAQDDINLTWTAGDQAKLFLSNMPGDRVRTVAFDQTTTVSHIGTSGFNYASTVGDKIKPLRKESLQRD